MESAAGREKKKAKKPEWGNLLGTFLPYLVIAAATLAVFYVWISNSFITGGDDFKTHLGLVYDLAYGFEHGFVMSTNHVYLGIFAYNASLFYGMLPHYSAAVLKTLFSFAGADLIGSMKTVSLSIIICHTCAAPRKSTARSTRRSAYTVNPSTATAATGSSARILIHSLYRIAFIMVRSIFAR